MIYINKILVCKILIFLSLFSFFLSIFFLNGILIFLSILLLIICLPFFPTEEERDRNKISNIKIKKRFFG